MRSGRRCASSCSGPSGPAAGSDVTARRLARPTVIPRAHWNGATLAETDDFEEVEGNVYFPPETLKRAHFEESDHTSVCGWKGTARYYHVVVDGERNENAAWYYPEPKEAAKKIAGHVAFWHGVEVER